MPITVTEAERASFLCCGRPWDSSAGMRQNLEPANRPAAPDLDRAIRDALAVYYFPGMWDWDNGVRLPLVGQELDRTLTGEARAEARALIDRYIRWAPSLDRFARSWSRRTSRRPCSTRMAPPWSRRAASRSGTAAGST